METSCHSFKCSLLAKLLCTLVVVGLFNVHIALYQGYAWITMLNDRIPEQGIENAITTTFSGNHPCDKCRAVAAQREKKQQQEPIIELKPNVKISLICSVWHKINLYPYVGRHLAYLSSEHLPLAGFSSPVIGPPPQFV